MFNAGRRRHITHMAYYGKIHLVIHAKGSNQSETHQEMGFDEEAATTALEASNGPGLPATGLKRGRSKLLCLQEGQIDVDRVDQI